jgi:hypothetical protein
LWFSEPKTSSSRAACDASPERPASMRDGGGASGAMDVNSDSSLASQALGFAAFLGAVLAALAFVASNSNLDAAMGPRARVRALYWSSSITARRHKAVLAFLATASCNQPI